VPDAVASQSLTLFDLKQTNWWRPGLQVKTYAVNNSSGHTFYVMNADGSAPDRSTVEEACAAIGGRLVDIGCAFAPLCARASGNMPPGFNHAAVSTHVLHTRDHWQVQQCA